MVTTKGTRYTKQQKQPQPNTEMEISNITMAESTQGEQGNNHPNR